MSREVISIPRRSELLGGVVVLLVLAGVVLTRGGDPRATNAGVLTPLAASASTSDDPARATSEAAGGPVIHALGIAGMAPFTVHVHALDSELKTGSPLTARYEWDFGDPAGDFNHLEAWNAAHVYDAGATEQVWPSRNPLRYRWTYNATTSAQTRQQSVGHPPSAE